MFFFFFFNLFDLPKPDKHTYPSSVKEDTCLCMYNDGVISHLRIAPWDKLEKIALKMVRGGTGNFIGEIEQNVVLHLL